MKKKMIAALCAAATACSALCAPVSAETEDDLDSLQALITERITALLPQKEDLADILDGLGLPDALGELGDLGDLGALLDMDVEDLLITPGKIETPADSDEVVVECFWYLADYITQDIAQTLGEDALDSLRIITIDTGSEPEKGDLDLDSIISIDDAQQILTSYVESIAGQQIPYFELCTADVDGDLSLTAADAQYTLMYYVSETLLQQETSWETILAQLSAELENL